MSIPWGLFICCCLVDHLRTKQEYKKCRLWRAACTQQFFALLSRLMAAIAAAAHLLTAVTTVAEILPVAISSCM